MTPPRSPLDVSPTAFGQCENRASHQTQYPRFHEIAHAMGVDYRKYSRAQAEVIVDTVSFVVGSSVHLDLGGEAIPYVAGWGENGALEAVSEHAATIDMMGGSNSPTSSVASP